MKNILFLLLFLSFVPVLFAQETIIRNISLIDVNTGKTSNRTVVISGDKIEQIAKPGKIKYSEKDSIIDGTGKYLMPGLVDSHIHFFQSGGLYTRPDAIDLRNMFSYEKEREQGLKNTKDYLKRYLRLGITTVVDVGGPFSNFAIRDSVSKELIAPDILVTGPLFSIVARPKLALDDPPIVKVSSAKDIDSLFTKMLPYKPDFIKVWYIANDEYPAKKSFPLVEHVGKLAAANGLKLAVHSTQLQTARLAVQAGASILVHSVDDHVIPDDFIKVLKKKNVTYIPTLIVSRNYYKAFSGTPGDHPQDLKWANPHAYGSLKDLETVEQEKWPSVVKWLKENGIPEVISRNDSIMAVNLRKLIKTGVNIATGTDAGNIGTQHASSYIQELRAMQDAGLTTAEILKASTVNPASAFGLENSTGIVEEGKQADLLLLNKNPLESLDNLNSIYRVIKKGQVIQPDSILTESPEMVVQRQVNAYNARNMDAFLDTYSGNVEIFDADGKRIMQGKEMMRANYQKLFDRTSNLHCEIENRIIINNKVIDKEKVRAGERTFHAVAMYKVENGKITQVDFIK
ncbi:amidohydrolase family protein [Sinomicrobium weinanense]|uniref:Amidohydrolase family protein n=1 Tax=Sinomicrobium weinanense TaxID=2842200 RepID=A0A926JUE2_9FLAO|nr:amidohydrolase family protein [Sinomicrobium weinanense]MBC9797376.1 amidohydrolase family protein [Sinomicrobium weinanense]MBU3123393.1 amidohydrolase family protein [Sinomicrobium weinanense]